MALVIAGAGLGLFNSSSELIGGAGPHTNGSLGQANGKSAINAATGNLVIQFQDEHLSGSGADLRHLRTYNSQGSIRDGDADKWRWAGEKRVSLTGVRNSTGSQILRTTGDGHVTTFDWNGRVYQSTDGTGAHDTIEWTGSAYRYVEGTTKFAENYDAQTGWIKSSRDLNGNGFDYAYSQDKLTRISDVKSDQTFHFIYGVNGKLAHLNTSKTSSGVQLKEVSYRYDHLDRLTYVDTQLDPSSLSSNKLYSTHYLYDGASQRISAITQSDGTRVNYTYQNIDGSYKIRTVTDQSGTNTFSYGQDYTQVKNGVGEVWHYYYDQEKRLIRLVSPAVEGQILSTEYSYDADSNLTKVIDSKGHAVNYVYDDQGNLIRQVNSLGHAVTHRYIDNLRVTSSQYDHWSVYDTSNGKATHSIYDAKRQLRFTVNAEGDVTESKYNALGLVSETIAYTATTYNGVALGSNLISDLQSLEQWSSSQDKSARQVTQLDYDHRGNISQTSAFSKGDDPRGILDSGTSLTEYTYDQYGQLLQSISVTGSRRNERAVLASYIYDGLGRNISITSQSGTSTTLYEAKKTTIYNVATGLTTLNTFDDRGRAYGVSISDGSTNRKAQYFYDLAGRLRMEQDSAGARSYIFYNRQGLVSHTVNAVGAIVSHSYDANGQVVSTTAYANKANTSGWFNAFSVTKSHLSVGASGDIRPDDNDRKTRFTYDSAGRLLSTTEESAGTDRATQLKYDGASRVVSSSVGRRETRFFYDKVGRKIGELDANRYFSEHVYDNAGNLIRTVRYGAQVGFGDFWKNAHFTQIKEQVVSLNKTTLVARYFYDGQGRQVGHVNEMGYLSQTRYDDANRKVKVILYAGRVYASNSSTLNSLVGYRTEGASTVTTSDEFGRTIASETSDGTVTKYIYDAASRLVSKITAAGTTEQRATNTKYNAFGDVVGQVSGFWHGLPNISSEAINIYGTSFQYDTAGRLISEQGPLGQKTYHLYNKASQKLYTANASGAVTQYQYNAFGELTETASKIYGANLSQVIGGNYLLAENASIKNTPLTYAVREKISYNKLGLVSQTEDSLLNKTKYTYNQYGERELIDDGTKRVKFYYDNLGQITATVDDYYGSNAISNRSVYDGFGRVVKTYDGVNNQTTIDYAYGASIVTTTDALGRVTSNSSDFLGRVSRSRDAYNNRTVYTYDDKNRTATSYTAEGIFSKTWRNRHGEITQSQDGNGNIQTYRYNTDGQLKVITDADGNKTTNSYDRAKRLIATYKGNGTLTRYAYDTSNRVVQETLDPFGLNLRTRYSYDILSRKTLVSEGYGTSEQTDTRYLYDKNNRLVRKTVDSQGLALTKSYTYNTQGHVLTETWGSNKAFHQQKISYQYDNLGRKISKSVDPDGLKITTRYFYDRNNNLTRTIDGRNASTWYLYNDVNERTHEVDAQGGVTAYEYDKRGLTHLIHKYANKLSAAELSRLSRLNAPNGIILPSEDASLDRKSYSIFDKDGRAKYVLQAENQSAWSITENIYDKNNNVIEARRFDKFIDESRVNAITANSITPEEISKELKALGRETNFGNSRVTRYAYDSLDRLIYKVDALGFVVATQYDAANNVTSQTEYATKPTLSGNYSLTHIRANLDQQHVNNRTTRYFYDKANRLIAQWSPTTTLQLSDGKLYTGEIKSLITYDSKGQVIRREEGIVRSGGKELTTDSRVTRYEYDKAGRQTKTILPGWYSYTDGRVHKAKVDNSYQRSINVSYDAFGNAVSNRTSFGSSGAYITQTKIYDAANREIFDIDGERNVTEREYDAAGNVTELTRYSRKLSSIYGSSYWNAGNVSQALTGDNQARTLSQVYDLLGRKTEVRQSDAANNYTASLTGVTNPFTPTLYSASPTTKFEYNAFGESVKQSVKINKTQWADSYQYYDRMGRSIVELDAHRKGTTTTFNALGDKVKLTEHFYGASPTVGDPPSLFTSKKDRVLRFYYDLKGQELRTVRDNANLVYGSHTSWQSAKGVSYILASNKYDAFGAVTESTDAANNKTRFSYNNIGQITQTVEPKRTVASASLDPFSDQVEASPFVNSTYNVLGNIVKQERQSVSGAGHAITTSNKYDFVGNKISSTDARGFRTDYKYDAAGRMLEQSKLAFNLGGFDGSLTYFNTIKTQYEYDAVGRKTAEINYINDKKSGTLNYYNAFGEVETEYKVWGKSTSSTHGLTKRIFNSYRYDRAGRILYKVSADGYTHYFYDLQGNATRIEQRGKTDSRSSARVTENIYDTLGRNIVTRLPQFTSSETGAAADLKLVTPKIQKFYDRWGNVTRAVDAKGTATYYAYNHDNQLTLETTAAVKAWRSDGTNYIATVKRSIDYDRLGRAVRETHTAYDGSKISRTKSSYQNYNKVGQLIRSTDATNISTNYVYDFNGNRVGTQKADQAVHKSIFDSAGNILETQVIRETYRRGLRRTPILVRTPFTLTRNLYDQAGRRYAEYDGANNARFYSFDTRGLVTVTKNRVGGVNRNFYDELGNKIRETEDHRLIDGSGGEYYDKEWVYSQSHYDIGRTLQHTVFDKASASDSEYYNYSYNNFGQLVYETGGNLKNSLVWDKKFVIKYDYYKNGLQKSVTETLSYKHNFGNIANYNFSPYYSSSSQNSSSTYHFKQTQVSASRYNLSGKLSNQLDHTQKYDSPVAPNKNLGTTVASRSVSYQYDELGRFASSSSSADATGVKLQSKSVVGVNLQYLEHRYDEWGNRRAILSRANSAGSSALKTSQKWFDYDKTGRVLVESNTLPNRKIFIGKGGVFYQYDASGRRIKETAFQSQKDLYEYVPTNTVGNNNLGNDEFYSEQYYDDVSPHNQGYDRYIGKEIKFSEKVFSYNYLNLVESIDVRQTTKRTDQSAELISTTYSNYKNTDSFKYDTQNRGFRVEHVTPDAKTQTSYNEEGKTTHVQIFEPNGNLRSQTFGFKLDNSGVSHGNTYEQYDYNNLHYFNAINHYTRIGKSGGKQITLGGRVTPDQFTASQKRIAAYQFTYTTNFSFNAQYSGYKKSVSDVVTNREHTTNANSRSVYDTRGRLTLNVRTEGAAKYTTFFKHNAQSQIISKIKTTPGVTKPSEIQSYYYLDGNPLADFGTEGVNINPTKSIDEGGDVPESYTVRANDTLFSIAQSLYGDASLWYVLADANGLTVQPSTPFDTSDVGRSLTIPNVDKALPNTSNSFSAYNPDAIYGELLPSPITNIPPPPEKDCNVLAIVIVAIVAVVATVATAGVLGAAIGASAAGGSTGFFAVAGSVLAGTSSASLLATAGIAATASFVGSIVSQTVAVGLDLQDEVSLKNAAISGLTAGLSAGAGAAISEGVKALKVSGSALKYVEAASSAAKVAAGYTANHVSNQLFQVNHKFTWRGLLSSAASAAASSLVANVKKPGNFGAQLGNNLASGALSQVGQLSVDLLYGDSIKDRDWVNVTADAFGNALGGALTSTLATKRKIEQQTAVDVIPLAGVKGLDDKPTLEGELITQSDIRPLRVDAPAKPSKQTAQSVNEVVGSNDLAETQSINPVLTVKSKLYRDIEVKFGLNFDKKTTLNELMRHAYDSYDSGEGRPASLGGSRVDHLSSYVYRDQETGATVWEYVFAVETSDKWDAVIPSRIDKPFDALVPRLEVNSNPQLYYEQTLVVKAEGYPLPDSYFDANGMISDEGLRNALIAPSYYGSYFDRPNIVNGQLGVTENFVVNTRTLGGQEYVQAKADVKIKELYGMFRFLSHDSKFWKTIDATSGFNGIGTLKPNRQRGLFGQFYRNTIGLVNRQPTVPTKASMARSLTTNFDQQLSNSVVVSASNVPNRTKTTFFYGLPNKVQQTGASTHIKFSGGNRAVALLRSQGGVGNFEWKRTDIKVSSQFMNDLIDKQNVIFNQSGFSTLKN